MADEPDILHTTPPEGIPGALFAEFTRILLEAYGPGTQNPVTATGAGRKAERVSVELHEALIAHYEAVAAEEAE